MPAVTVATSPSVTGVPVAEASGSARSSSTDVSTAPTWTASVRSPSSTDPAGSATP